MRRENVTVCTVTFGPSDVEELLTDAAIAAICPHENGAWIRSEIELSQLTPGMRPNGIGARYIVTITIDHNEITAPP